MAIHVTPAVLPAVAALLLCAVSASAQDPGSRQTRDFVQTAAQSDQFEILEAESALDVSKDPQILAFAREMIQAHAKTSETLKAAAARSGLKQPAPGIASDQSMLLAALQSLRGVEFDKAYIKQQVLAHHAAFGVEQIYARSGDDPEVRRVATATVPIIQSHERMAEQIATRLGAS